MRQFDVFDNPIPRARPALPLVAILQSDLAETARERVVAPLAPKAAIPKLAGRLIPIVKVDDQDYAAYPVADRLALASGSKVLTVGPTQDVSRLAYR